METETFKIVQLLNGIYSAIIFAPFDKALSLLASKGFQIISLEENANLRMQTGRYSEISKIGNFAQEAILYLPGKGKFLTKLSPIMEFPVEATNAHLLDTEYYLRPEQVEKALSRSVKLEDEYISIDQFGEDEVTDLMFGSYAKEYGEFLREYGFVEMPVYFDEISEEPFARQVWFNGLSESEILAGMGLDLSCGQGVRGIRRSPVSNIRIQLTHPDQLPEYYRSKLIYN